MRGASEPAKRLASRCSRRCWRLHPHAWPELHTLNTRVRRQRCHGSTGEGLLIPRTSSPSLKTRSPPDQVRADFIAAAREVGVFVREGRSRGFDSRCVKTNGDRCSDQTAFRADWSFLGAMRRTAVIEAVGRR